MEETEAEFSIAQKLRDGFLYIEEIDVTKLQQNND